MRKKTVCLNMIVKNESPVIRRSLSSVKKLIDYWVIVDTGSTDGTQNIIREFLSDIPGNLYEYPWVNFSHNRNQALAHSKGKGDYLLFIDADEELLLPESYALPDLDKDYYFNIVAQRSVRCSRILLINNQLSWYWDGVVHEHLCSSQAKSFEVLRDIINDADGQDGHRHQDPRKYHKDAALLEEAVKKNPESSRDVFFLAQSYINAQEHALALKYYEKRAEMGGEPEVIFWSLYMIGYLYEVLGMPPEKIIQSYCRAYQFRPKRAEPLFRLVYYLYRSQQHIIGYALAKHAVSLPLPSDILFVECWIYEYGMLLALANSAFGIGKYEEAYSLYQEVLSKPTLSAFNLRDVQKNISIVQAILNQNETAI